MSASPQRLMTAEEIEAAKMLQSVTFPYGGWDSKFAATLQKHLALTPATLTDKMGHQLWRVFWRYRRQIRHPERLKYVRIAEERMVPDYRNKKNFEMCRVPFKEARDR